MSVFKIRDGFMGQLERSVCTFAEGKLGEASQHSLERDGLLFQEGEDPGMLIDGQEPLPPGEKDRGQGQCDRNGDGEQPGFDRFELDGRCKHLGLPWDLQRGNQ